MPDTTQPEKMCECGDYDYNHADMGKGGCLCCAECCKFESVATPPAVKEEILPLVNCGDCAPATEAQRENWCKDCRRKDQRDTDQKEVDRLEERIKELEGMSHEPS